jgi:AraC family transcriptional regulator
LTAHMAYERRIEPRALDWRSFAWSNGIFDTARRSYTEAVEGVICTPHHLIMVTLSGGARHQEVAASCGHRYVGADRAGAVSLVPAHCERRLKLRGVESEWASISLDPALLSDGDLGIAAKARSLESATFTNSDDPFLSGLTEEFVRLHRADGGLDATYCDAMSWSLAHYLLRRYGEPDLAQGPRSWKLPPWRLRRIAEYVEAHLNREIRIADLASLVGVSPGYLHRSFRATTGQTPLTFINERRVHRAMRILQTEHAPIAEIAPRVGFVSPSHFTRTFRAIAGLSPSQYRAVNGVGPYEPAGEA